MFESFSVVEFVSAMAESSPFALGIVYGVVTFLGKWGVSGKWQLLASLLSGLAVGGALVYFQIYPELPVEWFATGLYGLIVGLTASGVYETQKVAAEKGSAAALRKLEG